MINALLLAATLAQNAIAITNAAAQIDAAIVAKGGTTQGGLTNAAAAIAALPSGGGGITIECDTYISRRADLVQAWIQPKIDALGIANAWCPLTEIPNFANCDAHMYAFIIRDGQFYMWQRVTSNGKWITTTWDGGNSNMGSAYYLTITNGMKWVVLPLPN